MYARPIPIQAKVHFKNLQFLAVAYNMGVLSCAFDVVLTAVFFPLFKLFVETEMTRSQPIIVKDCIFKIRTYILCTISLAISYVSHLFMLIFVQCRSISITMMRTGS